MAGVRATQLIFMRAKLASLFCIFPTEDGGVSVEFGKDGWSFAVEIMPDGSLEVDGISDGGEVFEVQSFEDLSQEFFDAFDAMTAAVLNDED